MNDNTFLEFLCKNWKSYLFPVLSPIVVFIASYIGTNIGWRAVPAALVVTGIMAGLTTLKLHTHWYIKCVAEKITTNQREMINFQSSK